MVVPSGADASPSTSEGFIVSCDRSAARRRLLLPTVGSLLRRMPCAAGFAAAWLGCDARLGPAFRTTRTFEMCQQVRLIEGDDSRPLAERAGDPGHDNPTVNGARAVRNQGNP